MTTAIVDQILAQIERLSDEERDLLERRLAARFEDEWLRLRREAAADADRRGIDQAAIDRAVDRVRYGA